MNRAKNAALMVPILLALLFVGDGCASSKAQRAMHKTTDGLGLAANAAIDGLGEVLTIQAIQELGVNATEQTVNAWIQERPEWQTGKRLHAEFFAAYNVWIQGNAAAVSGDTVMQLDIGQVIRAAQELFTFVGRYVPAVAQWTAVPR